MRVKFNGSGMSKYEGLDGLGGTIKMVAGDVAEVSDNVARLLKQKYGANFDVVIEEKPEHAPVHDKLFRKGRKTKTKAKE